MLLSASADGLATVCHECHAALTDRTIPKKSLVAVDTGRVPTHLPQLTLVESMLLAPLRSLKCIVLMKPAGITQQRPANCYQKAYRGHVLAYPNPPAASALAQQFPLHPDSLPEHIGVVFMAPQECSEQLQSMARSSKCLQVPNGLLVGQRVVLYYKD